ncbi:MAG TPA: DUF4402 domain-containing protein [Caulobacteraceae bacterium]
MFIRAALAAAAALLALGSAPAWAQTYSPSTTTAADLGIIVPAATTSTNFSFASSTGTVTQSGTAVRRTAGTTRSQITIGCSGSGSTCGSDINVKIGSIGTPTGKAGALSAFDVTSVSGSITNVTGTNPLSFTIKPANKNTDASFYVGATLPITANNSAGSFGAATSQFYVYVAASPATPTTGITSTVSATTYRGLSMSGSTLNFGKVAKPLTGTTTVTLTPGVSPTRTVSVPSSPSAGWSQATFTITGENSMAISVTQASTLTLTGPGTAITANLTHTTFPTQVGSGSTGSQGTATFYTGGSFTIGTSQTVGSYSGTYNTTVSYN